MSWQVQEAKQRFSELVRRTLAAGPQKVTRHGEDVVVVIPAQDYERLTANRPDFKEFLMGAPEGLTEALELASASRPEEDFPREVELEAHSPEASS